MGNNQIRDQDVTNYAECKNFKSFFQRFVLSPIITRLLTRIPGLLRMKHIVSTSMRATVCMLTTEGPATVSMASHELVANSARRFSPKEM